MFADGDIAIFDSIAPSSKDGYYHIRLRTTDQMLWNKQIPDSHYSESDRWIHKIYKEDLFIQLSFIPDFPVWIILCDYNGNENTTLMKFFGKTGLVIQRNRQLENENNILRLEKTTLLKKLRRGKEHPDEIELEKLQFAERLYKMNKTPQQQFPFDQSGKEM